MNQRKQTLIKRELQLRMVLQCGAVVGLAVLVQSLLIAFVFSRLAANLPNDGLMLHEAMPRAILTGMLTSLALLAPFVFALGLRYSHRIAGPVHRMEETLRKAVASGEFESLRLREGDELQELAGLVAQALSRLEAAEAGNRAGASVASPRRAA